MLSIYHSVKHPMFDLHLKVIHKDPVFLLPLQHLKSASKSLTTRNLVQEISKVPGIIFFIFLKVHRLATIDLKVLLLKKSV